LTCAVNLTLTLFRKQLVWQTIQAYYEELHTGSLVAVNINFMFKSIVITNIQKVVKAT